MFEYMVFKANCHVTKYIVSFLLIHIVAVSYVIFHMTLSWKHMNFLSLSLCFLGLIFSILSVPFIYSTDICSRFWLRHWGHKAKQKFGAALEEVFPLRHMKKQIIPMPLSLLLLSWELLLCHFLKIGIKLLIAQRTGLGRKLKISGRRANTDGQL